MNVSRYDMLVGRWWLGVLFCSLLISVSPAIAAGAETLTLERHAIAFAIPDGWSTAKHANIHKIYNVSADQQATLDAEALKAIVQISVHTEQRLDHADALQRLRQIAAEGDGAARFLEIGGWPALQRRALAERPQPGQADPVESEGVWMMTTAVAVADLIVRLEAWAPPTAPEELLSEIEAIGAGLRTSATADPDQVEQEVRDLKAGPLNGVPVLELPDSGAPVVLSRAATEAGGADGLAALAAVPAAGSTRRVTNQAGRDSELEIAVADGGRDIVIGSNNGFFFSGDGGRTWNNSANVGSNDPSISWGISGGAQGTFYAANINTPGTGLWTSTNGGANFAFQGNLYVCGQGGDPACGAAFPDQEHIVTDRLNVTAGGDQVYSAWRHLDGNWGIVCSADSGATWSANGQFFAGDLPKIGAGADGSVYVVYHPSSDDDILIHKFSSCENALAPAAGFPRTVVTNPGGVACPVPGLDRCNRRNSLASPTVAVDDTNSNHVYVAYASNTNPGSGGGWFGTCNDQNLCNENIVVQDSPDGGFTWSPADPNRTVTVSSGVVARRFMPWACAVGGEVHVTWFDRRAASPGGTTVSNNSLTDFYRASAFLNPVGNLTRGAEIRVSEIGSTDAQCEAGFATGSVGSWPAAVDRVADSESCSVQPQRGGVCCVVAEVGGGVTGGFCTPGTPSPSSFNRCDFDQDVCPAGEVCAIQRGAPKYGDYNGSACAEGRFYMTWASATSPPSISPASTNIDTFFAEEVVCCVPEIQVPAAPNFGTSCTGDGLQTATLDVCNTGKEDLVVGSIASSNSRFAVSAPLGGFPVSVSPDFCFPFQVTFDPSMGPQAGTLTVNSNDPVTPSLSVAVSASVGSPDIQVAIANAGNFGEVCTGDFADLNLSILNQGNCNLTIDDISVDDPRFVLPDDPTFPLVLSPDADFNLPVRFEPDACGPNPLAATVTISSDDPDEDPLPVAVSGSSPCPDIQVAIANAGSFGKVCKGEHADLDLTLFNQGRCDLTISNIELVPDAGSFELPADLTFPLVLSHDADFTLPIRFSPDQCFDVAEMRTVKITSDDPDEMMVNVDVSGVSPCPNLVIDPADLTGLFAFPPTVVDTQGDLGCFSERSTRLRNNGECPLTISGIAAAGADFAVTEPAQFPILLPPGEETLSVTVRFTPQADANPLAPGEVTGQLTVVSDDPDGDTVADLCGESVQQSGVRILVTDQSGPEPVPVGNVDVITLRSKGKHTPSPINLRFTNQPLSTTTVCGNQVNYHVDQETLPATETTGSNPRSSYEAAAKEGNLQASESFGLGQCEFRESQLQLEDSDSPACLLAPKGAPCTTDGECCSGKCRGRAGGKTCK